MKKRVRAGLLIGVLVLAPAFVYAQGSADGSVPPSPVPADSTTAADPAPAVTPVDSGTAAAEPAAGSSGGSTQGTQAPTGTQAPAVGTVRPAPAPVNPSSVANPAPTPNTSSSGNPAPVTAADFEMTIDEGTNSSGTNPWLWPLIGAAALVLAIIPFGFFAAGWMKKKPRSETEGSENRCFDIKQLMEEKLKELTDVQAMAKEQAVEKGKEVMRDAVSGTATGDLLVKAQKLEEQYKKLRALYEECQIDVDHYALKGVLLENSLIDKRMIRNLRTIRTRTVGDQVLHDIRISKSQIADIQSNIKDQNWFFHLWEPGKDDVTVVFRDKIFSIKHSDKRTWEDAIVHGVLSGIPQEKLVFDPVQ